MGSEYVQNRLTLALSTLNLLEPLEHLPCPIESFSFPATASAPK